MNLAQIKSLGISKALNERDAFDVTLELREIDQLGKIADLSSPKISQRVDKASYIKLINVPTPLDIGGTVSDPTDGALDLNMIDFNTLSVFQKFLTKSKNPIE